MTSAAMQLPIAMQERVMRVLLRSITAISKLKPKMNAEIRKHIAATTIYLTI